MAAKYTHMGLLWVRIIPISSSHIFWRGNLFLNFTSLSLPYSCLQIWIYIHRLYVLTEYNISIKTIRILTLIPQALSVNKSRSWNNSTSAHKPLLPLPLSHKPTTPLFYYTKISSSCVATSRWQQWEQSCTDVKTQGLCFLLVAFSCLHNNSACQRNQQFFVRLSGRQGGSTSHTKVPGSKALSKPQILI